MTPTDTSSPKSTISSPDVPAQRFATARMPIEGPLEDLEEAVEQLRQCSSTELRRARKHHRRALESLRNGGYSALSDATRDRLADRLRGNLEALNRALYTAPSTDENGAPASPDDTSTFLSFSSRFRALVQQLW